MNNDIFQIMKTEKELASYDKEDKVISFKEMQELAEKNKAHIFAVKSALPSFDGMIGGFEGGELNVISGKTGGGKTLFAQTLTKNFSDQGIRSLWFSYEMPPYNFLKRFPNIPEAYMPQILTAKDPRWIEARIWEAKLKYDTRIVFIDHLHYLVDMARMQNMSIEIGEIMRSLKKIAIKHNIVLFLIAHTKMTNEDDELGLGSVRDCLPADQLVYVDGKRIRVDKIKKGDNVVSYKSIKELQDDKVLDVWKSGKKKIFELTTKTGRQIQCSDGHKFYALTYKKANKFNGNQGCGIQGWTPLKELKIGQKIATVKKYPNTLREDITTEQAIILGWLIGDGHITKKYHSEITANTILEAEKIKEFADKGFGLNCKISPYPNKNAFRIYLTMGQHNNKNNNLKDFLKRLKFNPIGKDKYIPEIIFGQSERIVGSFLSGLFQSDGCITKQKINHSEIIIRFDNISEELARGVKTLLLQFGITSWIGSQSMKKSGFRTKNSKIWRVSIYGQGIKIFGEKIGFYCYKKDKYENFIKGWKPKEKERNYDIYFDRIKSIEFIGEKETYDISMRGHHSSLKNNSFCVNDFITHNSGMIECEADNVFYVWRNMKRDIFNQSILKIAKNRKLGIVGKKIDLQFANGYLMELEKRTDEEKSQGANLGVW